MKTFDVTLKCSVLDRKHKVRVEARDAKEAGEKARDGSLAYFVNKVEEVTLTSSEEPTNVT